MPKQTIPIAELDPDAGWHPDANTAALHAVQGIGTGVEHAGVIYRNAAGKYSYSKPVGNEGDSFELQARVPQGHTIVGIYHNHPGTDGLGQVFSPADIAVANQLKVPSYVLFEKDGSLRRYDPGKTATRAMALPGSRSRQLLVADGDAVPSLPQTSAPDLPSQLAALRQRASQQAPIAVTPATVAPPAVPAGALDTVRGPSS